VTSHSDTISNFHKSSAHLRDDCKVFLSVLNTHGALASKLVNHLVNAGILSANLGNLAAKLACHQGINKLHTSAQNSHILVVKASGFVHNTDCNCSLDSIQSALNWSANHHKSNNVVHFSAQVITSKTLSIGFIKSAISVANQATFHNILGACEIAHQTIFSTHHQKVAKAHSFLGVSNTLVKSGSVFVLKSSNTKVKSSAVHQVSLTYFIKSNSS
jgi:hypothetical protein